MIRSWIRRRRSSVKIFCKPCSKKVSVPIGKAQLFVCIEDAWHTVVFTCPSCHCGRSHDPSKAEFQALAQTGIQTVPWSVGQAFSPRQGENGALYKPRRVPHTWLPFDEVDVIRLIEDMNTRDWFTLLSSYNPHES